jgi:nicotinate-nucleotide pyrophosphorylase (carboxylating)
MVYIRPGRHGRVFFFRPDRANPYFCGMSKFDEQLQMLVLNALQEDVGDGDHTTLACIPPQARGKAVLHIKQDGILAGMEIAEKILRIKEPSARFTPYKQDGDVMRDGEEAFVAEATVHTILQCERLILNCMQRMSGIATLTRQYVDRLQRYRTRILDTRKTTPNFRLLEKEAVRIGGGLNHRFGLFDMILLKDNHIDYAGSLEAAIEQASVYRETHKPQLKIEVETRSLDEVRRVLAIGKVDRIMLDNFTPRQLAEALSLIGERFETEASGGIHLGNIEEYARTGVDYVSVGALIHQARSLDMSLKAVIL